MRHKLLFIVLIVFICLGSNNKSYAYKISGTLKNTSCYYPRIYLEVIKNIDGFYSSNYQNFITSAPIEKDGHFTIAGVELPEQALFYRLYLCLDSGTRSSIITGSDRNYFNLIVDNKSDLNIYCDDFCKPYFQIIIDNSVANKNVIALQNLLNTYDSLNNHNNSDSRKQFIRITKYDALKHFADTTSSLLSGLWALQEMSTCIDSSFYKEEGFMLSLVDKFHKKGDSSSYANQLLEKFYQKKSVPNTDQATHNVNYTAILLVLLFLSIVLNIILALKIKKKPTSSIEPSKQLELTTRDDSENENHVKSLIEKLTIKEREILKMVDEGLSNKEIADRLNVEVSTIKTHISNIYQKTEIKSRREVAGIAKYL